jgi:hypothetical protein
MASFVWILLKYKLKHIVAVSRSRDRPGEARAANGHERQIMIKNT